jgi:acylphosphatase
LKVGAHVFITGRVQGVFFRSKTRNEAKNHGVTGWVRNLPDGRVEAIFEGNKENIEKLIDFVGKGPSGAKVTDLKINWQDYNGKFNDFEVRYF